ncbi:hypothetical protein [Streptomyces nymphaeiformis]|uniref:Uncharacterized protein n=1 Tax=Streptomyces nymphaeiformis TaxID=2663842 RepID=A0A7W7XE89_9ACTN|nr:hypothetical protein [Streptomyces nymphaeiformis]MBB4985010.1 hypothetical protein [Streptomyces nymphaeiformis]
MQLSTRNQPIHPRGEEPSTDDLKPTYRSTRADSAALTAALQPGMSLYIHHDGRDHEFTVTGDTGALRNAPLLAPAGSDARISLHQLLAIYGAIHTQPPSTERTPT